jgi:hypothetical protein
MRRSASGPTGPVAVMALLFFLAGCGGGSSPRTVAPTLNPFFTPYKDALYFSGQGKVEASVAALDSARTAWRRVASRPPVPYRNDGGWPERRDAVMRSLADAADFLHEGHAPDAHESLEAVRYQLQAQNQAVGVQAWPDLLLEFHDPMEDLVTADDTEQMEDQVPVLRESLGDLRAFTDSTWTPAQTRAKAAGVENLAAALDSVTAALRNGAALDAVRPRARALKQAFVAVYMRSEY